MTDKGIQQFSGVDPSLGYLFQIRLALLWSLRRLKTEPDFLVSIETFDDVTFETTGGNPTDLLQLKHHKKGIGSLTNASSDLWKTLRVWFEGHASGEIQPESNLCLITTGKAPKGTIASYLRTSERNIEAAVQGLNETATSSTNQKNAPAYHSYLSSSQSVRIAILEKIVVLDASPSILDLDKELQQEVYWAAGKENHSAFLERLEGWWFRRVISQLAAVSAERIGSVELEAQMSDLREQFKQEALPIDDDLLAFTLDDLTRTAHEASIFVRQLELINANKRRIAASIRDYYRAFTQRSRWLRDDLVVGMDLSKYEKRLKEEWELFFLAVYDDIGESAAHEALQTAGRSVLKWAESTSIPIRPAVTEPFVSRGSLHMLADQLEVGWHPEFNDRLAHLLKVEEPSA